MSIENKNLAAAIGFSTMSSYFRKLAKNSDQTQDILAKNAESINNLANKISAAAHRQLLMNEAKLIGTKVDTFSEELDALLAERQSYNEFLKKRTEFWKSATERAQKPIAKVNEGSASASCGDQTQSALVDGELQISRSELQANEGDKVKCSGPKMPDLADYKFSEATMLLLQSETSSRDNAGAMRPPRLEDYTFRSFNFLSPTDDGPVAKQAAAPTRPADLLISLDSCKKKNEVGAGGDNATLMDSFEKYPLADHVTGMSGSSKCSGGSLTGSFIEAHPIPANGFGDLGAAVGPLIRADLGFGDAGNDESTATFSSVGGQPIAPMSLVKQREHMEESWKVKQDSVRKPPMPRLRTIDFDSPSADAIAKGRRQMNGN